MSSLDQLKFILRKVDAACLACGSNPNEANDFSKGGPQEIKTLVCSQCGFIQKIDNGKIRRMTKEEKDNLPNHSQAEGIRESHDRAVRNLSG